MRAFFLYSLSCLAIAQANTLPENFLFLKSTDIGSKVKIVTPQKSEQEQQQDQLKDAVKKPIQGVTIEMFEANMTKDTSISVDYAPTFKQGQLIDNQETTTIKLKYKF